ncbi:ISAs1 family transposase, partial [Acinetobacter baumannii]
HSYAKTYAQGHGRTETRECWVLGDLDILDKAAWKDLHAVARLRCTRSKDNQTGQEEDRFYLTSLSPTAGAEAVMRAARLHWGIENGLHWTLDTA